MKRHEIGDTTVDIRLVRGDVLKLSLTPYPQEKIPMIHLEIYDGESYESYDGEGYENGDVSLITAEVNQQELKNLIKALSSMVIKPKRRK